MIIIDLARARQLLARAVGTQGRDFVYNTRPGGRCLYMTFEECKMIHQPVVGFDTVRFASGAAITGCLIGTALKLAGVDVLQLGAMSVRESHRAWRAKGLVDIDPEATRYFQTAQVAQDEGMSWGHAFDNAEEDAKNRYGVK
jgi:hypothetical protein